MRHKFNSALLGIPLFFAAVSANGQAANAGDIRGTATDASGALLPDVTVIITNTGTGVAKTLITNKDGLYDTGPIVTGNYSITFSKDGFSNFTRTGLNLDVQTVTVDGSLKVGGAAEQVTVNTDVALIQTESGEQSATLNFETMEQLPNVGGNGPDWQNFTNLIAGATGTPSGSQGVGNPGQMVAVNGSLPYTSVLADGAEATLPSSGNADVDVFETIQEVKVSTSSFSAQYGVGGILFNQITKGGTNRFHGSAYEYNQNDYFNSVQYFATQRNRVRFNNFGGSIGGPVLKDKAFFYFDYDQIINNSAVNGFATVPTVAERNGDFTQLLVPGVACAPTAPTTTSMSSPGCIYNPATQVTVGNNIGRTPFAGNIIPQGSQDPVAVALQAYYPLPNRPGNVQLASFANGSYTPGLTTNNYFYQASQPNPFKRYFGRFDYNLGAKNRLTATVTQRDNPAFSVGQNICPVNCYNGDVDSTNAQITDVTTFSSNFTNEIRMGYTKQLNFFVGTSFGAGIPAKVGLKYAKVDGFPSININHELGLGPGINAVYKEHVFDPSDVVTLIRGRHVLHFGGEFLINEDNSTNWGNLNPGSFTFTGDYTKGSMNDKNSGFEYADFLVGTVQHWTAQIQPEYAARQKAPQVFIQDDYKIRPNLTLNLGLRYQIQLGWHDAKNNEAVFDPTILNSATNTLGAIWYEANGTNGRTSLQQNKYTVVMPRVGFAYTPSGNTNTVLRGGFGLYSYSWSLDTYGAGQGAALSTNGDVQDSSFGLAPITTLNGTGANLPFLAASTNPASKNGQGVSYNAYNTPVAQIMQYNFSIERQMGNNFAFQTAYVGSHGYNLVFPTDLDALTVANLGKGQSARPYPQYTGISGSLIGAISNYNSLQVSARKRLAHGFSFDTSYVWSKFLNEQDSAGWGGRGGTQTYQDAYNFRANYGPSNFDVRNAWKGNVVYNLPFGVGGQFLTSKLLDPVIGGWRASATFIVQGGNPFTPTVNTSSSFAEAGNGFRLRPNLVGNPRGNKTLQQYFNTAAFQVPAPNTFGNAGRNSLYGPGFELFNASLGKTFHYNETIGLSIRADVNNVLNHPTFGVPNTDVNAGGGVITSTSNQSRNMQLSARFAF